MRRTERLPGDGSGAGTGWIAVPLVPATVRDSGKDECHSTPGCWSCSGEYSEIISGVLLLGASWQHELVMVASQVGITAQQSCPARMPAPEKHAIVGAAVHERIAMNISSANFLRMAMIPNGSHFKNHE
jgi:hypothetical protein